MIDVEINILLHLSLASTSPATSILTHFIDAFLSCIVKSIDMPNMRVVSSSCPRWCASKVFAILLFILSLTSTASLVSVSNVTFLGPQLTPDVEDISRDGGYSVVVNGNIVWLYDDTECFDAAHTQLSFVSNTGAFGDRSNVSLAADFGVVDLGKDTNGKKKTAILAGTTVATGGWIPFQDDELHFNDEKKGQERVAICKAITATMVLREGGSRLDRARHFADIYQHDSGFPLCSSRIRRLQTTRPE